MYGVHFTVIETRNLTRNTCPYIYVYDLQYITLLLLLLLFDHDFNKCFQCLPFTEYFFTSAKLSEMVVAHDEVAGKK